MDRKKMVIEKYYDGELVLAGLVPSLTEIVGGLLPIVRKAEKFVVCESEMIQAGKAIWEKPEVGDLCKPPYPVFWVEEKMDGRTDGASACMLVTALPLDVFLAMKAAGLGGLAFDSPETEARFFENDVLLAQCFIETRGQLAVLPFKMVVPQGQISRVGIEMATLDPSAREASLKLVVEFRSTLTTLLVMLGTKNGCSGEKITVDEKLQAARAKRGKAPLFTYVRLTPNIGMTRDSNGRETAEAHMVRGHFKRRETGTYWWGHHVRGTGEVQKREAYVV